MIHLLRASKLRLDTDPRKPHTQSGQVVTYLPSSYIISLHCTVVTVVSNKKEPYYNIKTKSSLLPLVQVGVVRKSENQTSPNKATLTLRNGKSKIHHELS
jgi:hypothetical protein